MQHNMNIFLKFEKQKFSHTLDSILIIRVESQTIYNYFKKTGISF